MHARNLAAGVLLALPSMFWTAGTAPAKDIQPVMPLLNDSTTVLGQPFAYPSEGTPKIQSVIVTMQPGEQTGPHRHPFPTFGYILEGEVTVDYANGVSKTYHEGDALLEAIDMSHNGRNTGTEPVRILVVFTGVDGQPNSLPQK